MVIVYIWYVFESISYALNPTLLNHIYTRIGPIVIDEN